MERIGSAQGPSLERSRSLGQRRRSLCIGIPAHNEADTIAAVVASARQALSALAVPGEVVVAASACSDATSLIARQAGAVVIDAPLGKGAAVAALVARLRAEVLCLIDADVEYLGSEPLAAAVARPVVEGVADATLASMYWRPIYPQMWLFGFFAPLMGRLYPETLATLGPTPWTGQRAAIRGLWPSRTLPTGFTIEMALNLAWARSGRRVVTTPIDDWQNAERPKPPLIREELELILDAAAGDGRLDHEREAYRSWFLTMQRAAARYVPASHDATTFEQHLLQEARSALPGDARAAA